MFTQTITINNNSPIYLKGEQFYESNPAITVSGGRPGEQLYVRYIKFEPDEGGNDRHSSSQGWSGREGEIVGSFNFNDSGIASWK